MNNPNLFNPFNLFSAREALSLVPAGAIPVAIFPPYAIPRTFPAITVIFQEPGRGLPNQLQGSSTSVIKKIDKYFKCFRVRLNRHFGIRDRPAVRRNDNYRDQLRNVRRPGDFPNFDDINEGKVNSREDCFNDIPEPLYGFRTKVTLVDNEPCELGVTCDQNGNRIQRRVDHWQKAWQYDRQTGEEFVSGAPPDCRTNNIC